MTDLNATLTNEAVPTAGHRRSARNFLETVLTVLFAAAAVFFVSFLAVVTGFA
jgi:hypothetical protein